tara:strand:- start:453 stop:878 length:426 start_codon:yes stop_codon:yes gene_type:complete
MSSQTNETPNWDKITEGKVRHGFAVEAFKKGMELNKDTMDEVDRWVYFVIHGLEGLNEILKDKKPTEDKPKESLQEKIVETFNGEVLDGSPKEHVQKKIESALEGMDKSKANKVMKALKDGKITLNNLQSSLDRIQELKVG